MWTVTKLVAVVVGAAAALVWAPPAAAFVAAVIAAVAWCRWLEQHPEPFAHGQSLSHA